MILWIHAKVYAACFWSIKSSECSNLSSGTWVTTIVTRSTLATTQAQTWHKPGSKTGLPQHWQAGKRSRIGVRFIEIFDLAIVLGL